MLELPQGTVTFLFTDVEGSTRLWERFPEAMEPALARHDYLLRTAVAQNRGLVVKTTGDGCHAVFRRAQDGVACAIAAQRALAEEIWEPALGQLLVRMGLHTGTAEVREGDYYGPAVNRAARLMSAAHGGQILLSQVTRELVLEHLPETASTIDLGRHRLKDLSRPEHIFQLAVLDLPSDFPPPHSLDITPINLPVQTTPFVGRQEEIASLGGLLAQPDTRLVTLVGPGGAGKTRLAVEVAAQQGPRFKDGIFFVNLAPLSAPGQIVQTIIEALSIAITSGDDLKAQLLRYLRRKQLLLVMDNFEHLLDGARLLNDLLGAAPGVTLLATSREKLNLTGETALAISGLQFAEWRTPKEALAHAAGQLFVQSAQRAQPGFRLEAADVPYLARICRLVQGMPLAILLAAAWADMLSPGEIAAEIGNSLDFLETELRDIPARQRSIRAVFEGSWERLAPAERELFKRLSVFRGGFTRQAAGEVVGASLPALARLVGKSFLLRDPDQDRYQVHELLRQFADERLEAEARAAAQEAHAAYFTDLMEKALGALRSHRQKTTLDDIEADIENVRSAWRHLAGHGNAAEMGRIVETLWYFHEIRGWYHAGLDFFDDARATLRSSTTGDRAEEVMARMLAASAWFTSLLSLPEQGLQMARDSLATLQRLDRRHASLLSLNGIMISSIFLNRTADIIQTASEMHEVAVEVGDRFWEALSLSWWGSGNLASGDLKEAARISKAATETMEGMDNPWLSIWPAQVQAGLAAAEGDYAQAKKRYQFVLESVRSINFRRGLQYTYNNLGNVCFLLKEYGEAEEHFLQSLGISDEIGQTREMLATLYDLARVRAATDRPAEALYLLGVILKHPAGDQHGLFRPATIQEDAERLRVELEGLMTREEYTATWRQGQEIDLDTVATEMLS